VIPSAAAGRIARSLVAAMRESPAHANKQTNKQCEEGEGRKK
jgi:hypothetical protein